MNQLRRTTLLFAIALVLLIAVKSRAQVVGVSAVLNSTNSNEIDAYSATEIQDGYTAYYYDAGVIGYLYQDQAQQAAIAVENYQLAEAYPTSSVHQGSVYTVYSEHYLITYVQFSDGTYYNPDQYAGGAYFTSPGGGDPTGTGFNPGGGDVYVTQYDIYLGYTYVQISTAPPSITSINPSSDIRGSSGNTIQVQGQSLRDDLGVLTAVFHDSDITVSVSSGDATTASLSYNVSASAAIGNHQLTLSNTWGESEPVNFTVGYPPAVITGVSPAVWVAGNDYNVTVTGSGFGSNPSVTAIAAGIVAGTAYGSSPDGTQTNFHVHVDINAPNEPVQIVVTPGYIGSNYTCGNCNGQSPNGSSNVSVQAVVPTPTIMRVNSKADLSGCTNGSPTQSGQNKTDVFAGEQVLLCVQNPASGSSISNQTWSVQQASDITGGFVSSDGTQMPGAAVGGKEANRPATNQSSFSFFFLNINAGETVTYTWTLANGGQANATANFQVHGPSGNTLPNSFVQTGDSATQLVSPQGNPATLRMTNAPGMPNVGIWFNDLATLPSNNKGTFIWVQLLHSVTYSQIDPSNGAYTPPAPKIEGLDGVYPYPGSSTTSDRPSRPLYAGEGEGAEAFDATIYVLWDPAIPPAGQNSCTPATTDTSVQPYNPIPSTCASIPVPLASVRWRWSACAINALPPAGGGPSWFEHCGPGKAYPAAATGYPQWNSCNSSANADCH